jgi:hypothetical protein
MRLREESSVNEPISEEDRKAFELAMQGVYTKALKECGYNAAYYLRMLTDHGALATAQRLIAATQPSDGFTALWELKRLDLTVEYVALNPRWSALFTDAELATCRDRLLAYQMPASRLPS